MALLFLPGKGETQQASASRTVPPFSGIGRGVYILMEVLLFFFSSAKFQNGHSWHQATQQPGLLTLNLSARDLPSEMQNATRQCRTRRRPGAEDNAYEVRE